MRFCSEIVRLISILLISPAMGYGALLTLDVAGFATPQYFGKVTFFLLGFAVAIATSLVLFRIWPTHYGKSNE